MAIPHSPPLHPVTTHAKPTSTPARQSWARYGNSKRRTSQTQGPRRSLPTKAPSRSKFEPTEPERKPTGPFHQQHHPEPAGKTKQQRLRSSRARGHKIKTCLISHSAWRTKQQRKRVGRVCDRPQNQNMSKCTHMSMFVPTVVCEDGRLYTMQTETNKHHSLSGGGNARLPNTNNGAANSPEPNKGVSKRAAKQRGSLAARPVSS